MGITAARTEAHRRLGGLALAVLWFMVCAHAPAQEAPAVPVVIATADQRQLAPVNWYPGTVISRNDARLAAEVEGRLEWVAEVGARVKRGETVARTDATLLREVLAENQAAVARADARLAFLDSEVKRLEELARLNNAAKSHLDQVVADRAVARSELATAQARVNHTRERLARTTVAAPFNGVVSERLLQLGEWAESGKELVRLVDIDNLEIQVRVPLAALDFVKDGTELEITGGARAAKAPVRTIVPVGDDRSRLYELRLRIANAGWQVGQGVRVAVPSALARTVVAVPRDALVLRRDGISVYRVLADDTAERVEVGTGIAVGAFIEVSGGIRAGDRVVVRGGERLRPGQKVQPLGEGGSQ